MKKILLAALITLLPALTFAAAGTYIQAGAGINYVDTDIANQNGFYGFGGQVGLGYLWGDNTVNYGFETDGTFYPNSTTSSNGVDYKINGYNISLLGVAKYTDCASGFIALAKLGGAYVYQKGTTSGNNVISSSSSDNQIAPEGAVGLGYLLTPNLEMDLVANYVYTNNSSTGNNGNLLLTLGYSFA